MTHPITGSDQEGECGSHVPSDVRPVSSYVIDDFFSHQEWAEDR